MECGSSAAAFSKSFSSNTYKISWQLLNLNDLREQLTPLEATLTEKRGGT
jgi:hypothetical protein